MRLPMMIAYARFHSKKISNVPVIAFSGFDLLTPPIGGSAKNPIALEPSCHVVIITSKFGEFLPNSFGGDSVTDRETDRQTLADCNITPFFFQKAWP